MPVIVPNDLVGFQIPALDHLLPISAIKSSRLQMTGHNHLILSSGEHIRVSHRNREPSNGRNMSRQGELKLAARKVPYLQQIVHELALHVQQHQERAFQEEKASDAPKKTHLNDPISRASGKPLITRFNSNTSHPAQMPRNDAHEFPRRVIRRFDGARLFVQRERLSEVRRACQ